MSAWLRRERVPRLLTTLRLWLGPSILLLACTGPHPLWFAVLIATGLLSDIFDGILARRWGVADVSLRLYDTRTDLVFWLSVFAAAVIVHPQVLADHCGWVVALVAAEALGHAISWLRFGRLASTHALLSKLYGLSLAAGLGCWLCLGNGGVPFAITVGMGLLANLDVALILVLLPQWRTDVPGCWRAWRLRVLNGEHQASEAPPRGG